MKVGVYGLSRGGAHPLLLASLMVFEKLKGQPDVLADHSRRM